MTGIRELRVELGRRRLGHVGHIARKLAHGCLQAKANAQVGNLMRAGVVCGGNLALEGAHAEAARNEDAIHITENVIDR